jgi:hypothetical protein
VDARVSSAAGEERRGRAAPAGRGDGEGWTPVLPWPLMGSEAASASARWPGEAPGGCTLLRCRALAEKGAGWTLIRRRVMARRAGYVRLRHRALARMAGRALFHPCTRVRRGGHERRAGRDGGCRHAASRRGRGCCLGRGRAGGGSAAGKEE